MPRISKEDLIKKVSAYMGDDKGDEALSILEDISDSFEEVDVSVYEDRITTLENEKAALDEAWRARYKERFESKDSTPSTDPEPESSELDNGSNDDDIEPPSFEDIATEF